ncbi:matrilin-4-like isoform X15 [Xyrauchen texanus]|uniref:matrilin-4-like isoform X14 n=1 Tax=Xyrauchen texanus TaxID=154827 RepID=UPI002242AC6E|nr:matrilin-4-like isoform X14 [Xyrauchen texanus]XP_051986829.1 matrilin-4-like isoform X15 [Xyrauchen texanus]
MTRVLVYVGVLIAIMAATEGRPKSAEPKCKSGPVDLVFIIDSSRSVRPHEFETMRKFMINIIHELDISLEDTRVGVVQYSSQVQNVFSLKAFSKPAQMVKAINEIIPLAQGTMTGLAIRYAMNVAFSAEEGARPKVPHVAVIVTDGRPQDRVAEVAAAARESGIEIYAIGVARADMTSLRAMASPPFEDHVFLVESFDLIHQFGLQFQDKLCGMDLCLESDHGCDHICESSPGSYQCLCLPGYQLNEDGKTCKFIDLCAEGKHDCEQLCIASPGSFTCDCNKGYTLNEDKRTCTMIDYCSFGNDSCEHECLSVLNGFNCRCNEGYTLNDDLKTCTMIDYCSFGNDSCEHECVSVLQSFYCQCREGYTLNEDETTCTMIDYCSFGNDSCQHECVSVLNGFYCRCNDGYSLNDDMKTCTMIDYCSFGNDSCEHECVSVLKGFYCQCNDGYSLNDDKKTCTMIDYCSFGNHSCDHKCVSVLNGFFCRCNEGYTLQEDGKTCMSDNLCNTVEHGCQYQCVSTPGSYHCICPEGHLLQDDGKTCGTCRSSNIDLVLLIDGSKSVRPNNFELVKQFVNQVVDQLDVSPKGTRVGLVQYSSRVRTEFPLSMYQSKEEIKKAVMNVEYMEKGTMTGLALKHMVENSFTEANGARPAEKNIPRIGLVFTDGRSQDDITEWAKKAKEAGITMYAVGVGKAVEDELRVIASEPVEKNFFYTADFTAMSQIAENLKLNVCAAESQGEVEVKDPCTCESLVEFQQVTISTLDQLNQKLSAMTKRLEVLENQLLTRK